MMVDTIDREHCRPSVGIVRCSNERDAVHLVFRHVPRSDMQKWQFARQMDFLQVQSF